MVRDFLQPSVFAVWFQGSGSLLREHRSRLVIAQAIALVAMAFCYFLAPQFAWCYPLVAVMGYVALALPPMANSPLGVAGRRLIDASPGRQHLPGGTGYAIRLTGPPLVAFALPAAVAAALPSPMSERSGAPWIALVTLLGTAAVVVAAVRLAGPRRSGIASLVVVTAAVIMLLAPFFGRALSVLPELPGFWSN